MATVLTDFDMAAACQGWPRTQWMHPAFATAAFSPCADDSFPSNVAWS
jgi:hypothetical protein